MEQHGSPANDGRLAILGAVFLVPAVLLILAGPLSIGSNNILIHPVAVLGGIALTIVLNLSRVMRVQARIEDGGLVSVVRIEGRMPNLVAIAAAALSGSAILFYAFVENFQIAAR
jgi:hypothetical protein